MFQAFAIFPQSLGVDDLCKLFVNVAIDGFNSKSGDIDASVVSHSGNHCKLQMLRSHAPPLRENISEGEGEKSIVV